MWGYAEGNAGVIGVIVIAIAVAAVVYLVQRWRGRPGSGR